MYLRWGESSEKSREEASTAVCRKIGKYTKYDRNSEDTGKGIFT